MSQRGLFVTLWDGFVLAIQQKLGRYNFGIKTKQNTKTVQKQVWFFLQTKLEERFTSIVDSLCVI